MFHRRFHDEIYAISTIFPICYIQSMQRLTRRLTMHYNFYVPHYGEHADWVRY